jgi:hypothetical protein
MKIGIDFDNTIVSYDALFFQVALERNIIPRNLPAKKLAIREYLRSINQEDSWTLMQGEVYGSRMLQAVAYPGVFEFIKKIQNKGHQLFIISHKTKYPFLGPNYDLHKVAKNWLEKNMVENNIFFNVDLNAFFKVTKEEKINTIAQLDCDIFIDDLPEILEMQGFLDKTQKILFNPDGQTINSGASLIDARSWQHIENYIFK